MTYLILVWISASIGFVLGAAWSGLCRKNEQYDQQCAGKLKDDFYTNAQQGGMKPRSWSGSGSYQ